MRPLSPEVFVPAGAPVVADRGDLDALVAQALANPSGKCRLLLHEDSASNLHQMLIVQRAGNYIQPHIKRDSDKYYLMLKGEMLAVTFDEKGGVVGKTVLGEMTSRRPFAYRVDRGTFHTFVALSPAVAYLETVLGPFVSTEFAQWAPVPGSSQAEDFVSALAAQAE